jgi:hypothetical protein
MTPTPVDKRNFFLALSVSDGQALANTVGFSIPSQEVQQNELIDVVQKWMTLAAVGVVDQVRICSDWMSEAVDIFQNLDDAEIENMKSVLVCYSVALLSYLIDNEFLELAVQENAELDPDRLSRLLNFLTQSDDIELIVSAWDDMEEDDSDE